MGRTSLLDRARIRRANGGMHAETHVCNATCQVSTLRLFGGLDRNVAQYTTMGVVGKQEVFLRDFLETCPEGFLTGGFTRVAKFCKPPKPTNNLSVRFRYDPEHARGVFGAGANRGLGRQLARRRLQQGG